MTLYTKRIPIYGDGYGRVDYVQHVGTDLTVVNSARVSFGKEQAILNERDKKLINYLSIYWCYFFNPNR